jgi:predicted flavoprotein YhiN
MPPSHAPFRVAVIGGGPAGLMAAEVLAGAGVQVDVYDAMASVGRKFLLAGKGGMNITHAEPYEEFVGRYRQRAAQVQPGLTPSTRPRCATGSTASASTRLLARPDACSRPT